MNILFLAPLVPYPPLDGDRQRSYHLLKALALKHRVSLLCFYRSRAEREALQALRPLCAGGVSGIFISNFQIRWNCLSAWFSKRPLNVAAFQSRAMERAVEKIVREKSIDVVHAYRLRMAPYALGGKVRKRVLDYTDALTRYFQARLGQPASFWKKIYLQRELRCLSQYEAKVSHGFDACVISSPEDQQVLYQAGAARNLEVVTNGVDTRALRPGAKLSKIPAVLFVGNMQYPPNAEGIRVFCLTTWPRIKAQEPKARFQVVGLTPRGSQATWPRLYPGAEFLGLVPELQPHYANARVVVCPLEVASGRQFKVIEAFAAGVPCVTTPVVAKNLNARPERELLIGENPEHFAAQVIRLLRDQALAARIRKSARTLAVRTYDWPHAAQPLLDLYAPRKPKRKSA